MYNQNYIDLFEPKYYMSILKDYSFLTALIINHEKRHHDKTYNPYDDIVLESLTHYVLSLLKDNHSFKKTKEYQNFIDSLVALVNNDFTESMTNIFINNCNLVTDIKPFMSSYDYQHLLESRRLTKTQIDRIHDKLSKFHKVSQHDLDIVSDYHFRLRDTNTYEYQILIRYLFFNYFQLSIKNEELRAILAFLPSVYHLDNQMIGYDLNSLRIVLSDVIKTSNKYIIYISNININNILFNTFKEITNTIYGDSIDIQSKALLEEKIFRENYI